MEILFIPKNTADELMNIPLNDIESKFLEEKKIYLFYLPILAQF